LSHHVLTVNSPPGRMLYRRTTAHGQLRVRVRSKQIAAAGVERVPKVELLGAGAGHAPS